LVGSKIDESINSFFSTINYLPNFKQVKTLAMKSESILHFPIEDCVWATKTMRDLKANDPNVIYINAYDYYNYDDLLNKYQEIKDEKIHKFVPRSQCTFENVIKLPAPLNVRRIKCGTAYFYNKKEKTFMQITKPFIDENEEWVKQSKAEIKINQNGDVKNVKYYPMFAFSFTRYQEIDVGKVLYSQVSLINSGGWANSAKLMRGIVHDRQVKIYKSTIASIQKLPKDRSKIKEEYQLDPSKKEFDGMAKMVSDLDFN
jgi:hypothetical protein